MLPLKHFGSSEGPSDVKERFDEQFSTAPKRLKIKEFHIAAGGKDEVLTGFSQRAVETVKNRKALDLKAEQVFQDQSRPKFSTSKRVKEETCLKFQGPKAFAQVFHRIKTKSFPDFAAEEGKICADG